MTHLIEEAHLTAEECGVRYHVSQGWRILRQLGWVPAAERASLAGSSVCSFYVNGCPEKNIPERIRALPPGGPPPRAADGHPDLSGVWFPNGAGIDLEFVTPDDAFDGTPTADSEARRQFDPKVTPEEKPPFQPWAAEKSRRSARQSMS